MTVAPSSLDDSFNKTSGRVYLTGMQALVRLPLLQKAEDVRAGLRTAGFITGYRGSPLGGYDLQLERQAGRLQAHDIRFQPALNEELAATAIWGTQQASQLATFDYDGVFGLWYGKGPGVDRAGDAIMHGNRNGASRHGGVLLAFGDDHAGKSSTTSHQSDGALAANGVPVLYPATVGEYISLGLLGWALSRYSGLWVGLKCVNETAEATATVDLKPAYGPYVTPPYPDLPPEGLHGRVVFDPNQEERLHVEHRLPAAARFARANAADRVAVDAERRSLGIVTAGKAYLDVIGALDLLGIDEAMAQALGVRVYKLGLVWPVERDGLTSFAAGHREILVVEEKQDLIEQQAASALYHLPADSRPSLVGKRDEKGGPLVPAFGTLSAIRAARIIGRRLDALGLLSPALRTRLLELDERQAASERIQSRAGPRRPWFCSGCPHNSSTRIPEGSMALSGIGCHTMALWMDRDTLPPTQMGGEGANWIGMESFVRTGHIFQNLGDGTYNHSGILAIRAAVAAGSTITFKILYNDAVAMTGGQAHDGRITVPDIIRQVLAERAACVVLVTDDPGRYKGVELPASVSVRHRDNLLAVQKTLRDTPGVTVLVYDQTCAAELRRRRKRGKAPEPASHVMINELVCEGCGDCSVQSNCVSVLPKPTAFGVKREIDQSSCNKDYSCLKGFCPSFVTVTGATIKKAAPPDKAEADDGLAGLPEPQSGQRDGTILVAGIGGTGIVTIGAVLGMAAHLEGKRFAGYDMTGLAQKGGAVYSHLRISGEEGRDLSPIVGTGEADVVIGCDLSVAATGDALAAIERGRTMLVLNDHTAPPGDYHVGRAVDLNGSRARDLLRDAAGQARSVKATAVARRLLGDSIGANMIMVGYAYQCGALPVSASAIERAIALNGVAVAFNRQAFRIGRRLAHDPGAFDDAAMPALSEEESPQDIIGTRAAFLTAYQSRAYAGRYRALADLAENADRQAGGTGAFAEAVARGFFKLMAYKDEYEVARLYTDGSFRRQLEDKFEGDYKLEVHMAPPILAQRDKATGAPVKRPFGAWVFTLFRFLAAFRFLRGTPFDPFGYTAERRTERTLIDEYETLIRRVAAGLTPARYETATAIARFPDEVRGFGHIKERHLAAARDRLATLITDYEKAETQQERREPLKLGEPAE